MASLLVDRPCEDWLKVYDSIGFGNNGDNTEKILSYSYYDLPSYLKPCLLQLSIFPEDIWLDTKGVIRMWIDEGFVHLEKKEDSLSEVGERYFKQLVNRSMIQLIEDQIVRFARWFHIHDIVFDLIRKLSRDEDFIAVLDSKEKHSSSDSLRNKKKTSIPRLDGKVRRLALVSQHVHGISGDAKGMLRSLNIFSSKVEIMVPLHSFKFCRVLYIERSYVPISLKNLGKLLHLKHLMIAFTPIDELPVDIGHPKSLQTQLGLCYTGLDELPPAVCSLTRLMCLRAEGFLRFPTDRMENLTSLEDLRLESVVGRSATEDLVVQLRKLVRLRVIIITFFEGLEESLQKALVQSLCNLQELQGLVLSSRLLKQPGSTVWEDWEPPRQLRRLHIQGITFLQLPRWINRSCLPHLYFLSLDVYSVEVEDLDNLVRLLELRYLKLEGLSWPPVYTVGTNGFRNLRFCHLGTTLKFHVGAMPRLEALQFGVFTGYFSWEDNGVLLEQFPTKEAIEDLDLGLDNLLSLEQVTVIVDCSGATAAEVQEVEAVVACVVEIHPNRPTMKVDRVYEENILSDEEREARLQHHIEEHFRVLEWKDKPDAQFISHLRSYRHLQKAVVSIDCAGASMCEVENVETAITHAAKVHRNHPTIQLIRTNTGDTASSSDHPNTDV